MHETHYQGAIWTNHAKERLTARGMSQDTASTAFTSPDHVHEGKQPGTKEFVKKIGDKTITLIAKKNDRDQWVVISCWIDPPLYGYMDHKKQEYNRNYYKAGFWGKVWLIVKSQLGF